MTLASVGAHSWGASKAKLCRADSYHSQASWQSSSRSLRRISLGSQLTWEKANRGFQSTSHFPPKAVTVALWWDVNLLTVSCCFTDTSQHKRKMLESQAVKSLEETCRTFVFKSLFDKSLTDLNAVARSNNLSTQIDWPQSIVMSPDASWRGLILFSKEKNESSSV